MLIVALQVDPDEKYEAWDVSANDGLMIVSLPGGELAYWEPRSSQELSGTTEGFLHSQHVPNELKNVVLLIEEKLTLYCADFGKIVPERSPDRTVDAMVCVGEGASPSEVHSVCLRNTLHVRMIEYLISGHKEHRSLSMIGPGVV